MTRILPSPRYRTKIRWLAGFALIPSLLGWLIAAAAIAADPDVSDWVGWLLALAALPPIAIAVVIVEAWVSSIWYELREDDLLVHRGVLVQSLKVIPFRNITNIARKRDILDRWVFALGSLEIETAGSTPGGGSDANLAGLDDWEGLYQTVMTALARFRSRAMPPTAAGTAPPPPVGDAELLTKMLSELRSIRSLLEQSAPHS